MSRPNNRALDSKVPSAGQPLLCYVTDRRSLPGPSGEELTAALLAKIEAAAAAEVNWIQVREKDLSGRDSASLTKQALQRVSRHSSSVPVPTRILVNGRLDVALSEHAGGVHLGEDSLPVFETRRFLQTSQAPPADFLVGVSCHSVEAAIAASGAGADYIFFGPVFATPSKAVFGAPQGLDRLAEVCRSLGIPVLAIGGITLANAASCFSAGASGIAAIRLFQDATDMAAIVRAIRQQPS